MGRGQTIGQRIARVQVVGQDGTPISMERSLLRYFLLLGPILLSSDVLHLSRRFGIKTSIGWLLFGAEVAIVYLYLFNRNTRQSLHDLVTDTYVVDAESVGRVEVAHFWRGHWAILGGAALVGAALSIGFGTAISRSGPFPELIAVQQAVLNSGKVQSVGASIQKNWGSEGTNSGLNVFVVWSGKSSDTEKDATEIANIALRADPRAANRDFITVIFREGFMIGFARFSYNRPVSHSPATWIKQAQSYGLR